MQTSYASLTRLALIQYDRPHRVLFSGVLLALAITMLTVYPLLPESWESDLRALVSLGAFVPLFVVLTLYAVAPAFGYRFIKRIEKSHGLQVSRYLRARFSAPKPTPVVIRDVEIELDEAKQKNHQ